MKELFTKISISLAMVATAMAFFAMPADAATSATEAHSPAMAMPDSVRIETPLLDDQETLSAMDGNVKPWSRELRQISFVPKGQWIAGVSVSYSMSDQKNYQFLIVENLNGDSYSFKVSPMLFYSFGDNLAAGGRLAYQRQRTKINAADLVLGAGTEYNVDNLYSISHSYHAMAAFRNYISLGESTRFGLFNEVQMQIGGGQSKLCNGTGDDVTGTYERSFTLNVGVAPGMIMFLNNYSAIEVNVGVLGFNYNHTRSATDQIYIANRKMRTANFKVNLFSITFGVAFYI